MDLLLEGILIAIMMAIILLVVIYEYSAFFAPKSSIFYYNSLVRMVDSACTSIQTASNVQFSSPKLFVFQMYDSPSCNSILSQHTNIFSPNSAVLSALDGNYDLCYANLSDPAALGLKSGNQYFFAGSVSKDNFYQPAKYALPNSSNLSEYALNNQLGVPAVEVNSSSSFSLILDSLHQINPSNYTFDIEQYSNTSVNINILFNGEATCSSSYSDLQGVHSLLVTSPCQQNVTNITVNVGILNSQLTNYQINVTATPDINSVSIALLQQCSNLYNFVENGAIESGSIVCQPILCGGTSFRLADQNNRPFLGLYGESYTFLGIQSGANDLQIVDSYPEQLLNSSIFVCSFLEPCVS